MEPSLMSSISSKKDKIEPLQSILEAREQRAILKQRISAERFNCLSLSLNVPGFPKSNTTVKAFFKLCLSDLKYHLSAHLIDFFSEKSIEISDAAGNFFVVPFSGINKSLPEIKQICESFEESHPLGRFIDVDINDTTGNSVSSGKSKLCFFCLSKPAIECRRENAHDQGQLRSFMFSAMDNYLQERRKDEIAKKLSALAVKSLLHEISLTPKPGLVDKFSNGSHADMNYQTFIDSTSAISPWFIALAHAGFSFQSNDLTEALPQIRSIGLRMEKAMFEETARVNTQKGLIFLMGLCVFACGKLFRQTDRFEIKQFRNLIKGICRGLVERELHVLNKSTLSHGEKIYLKYGLGGARAEAESGLITVFDFGLPQLLEATELNDLALKKCFLAIAAKNIDTNILYRRDQTILVAFQELCRKALENFSEKSYFNVIEFCKTENISPGGTADLLAVTIFVRSVIYTDQRHGFAPFIPNK